MSLGNSHDHPWPTILNTTYWCRLKAKQPGQFRSTSAIDVIVKTIIPIVETMLLRVGLKKSSEAYGQVIGLPIGTTYTRGWIPTPLVNHHFLIEVTIHWG